MHDLDLTVNMLGLCDPSNLLFVLSAEERRALLRLLWGLVVILLLLWVVCCVAYIHIGVSGATVDVRRYGAVSGQLETCRAWLHTTRVQGLGWPGRLERRLLPDTEGGHRRRRVRLTVLFWLWMLTVELRSLLEERWLNEQVQSVSITTDMVHFSYSFRILCGVTRVTHLTIVCGCSHPSLNHWL